MRSAFQQSPFTLRRGEGWLHEQIIGNSWHQFFRLERLTGTGSAQWTGGELIVAIVVEGNGEMGPGETPAHRGQTWLLPGCVEEWKWKPSSEQWEILLLKLPTQAGGGCRQSRMTSLSIYDYCVIGFYFAFMALIGWVCRKFITNTSDYFRGGGKMLWWMAGCSAFVAQFSAWTFTGAAGKAYQDGPVIMVLYLRQCSWIFLQLLILRAALSPDAGHYLDARRQSSVRQWQ